MVRILIVDDAPTDAYAMTRMLEGKGFEVFSASSGEEGILKARAQKPNLILMDIVMPGMNGFQATRELAKDPETSAIPVIMVTTKYQETDRVWGLRQGARDYVVKPPVESELLVKIEALVGSSK